MVNIDSCRSDFPLLHSDANQSLVFLDNASTTQKPDCVIREITDFYTNRYSNIHRGLYPLSLNATEQYDQSREVVKKFINAASANEIIFTKGTTESINMLCYCLGEYFFRPGDEIVLSILEHHSNIVPWQMLAKRLALKLHFAEVDSNCELSLDKLDDLITGKTRLVAITHISNSTGIINPVEEIIKIAKRKGALVMIDGAQSAGHKTIDVQQMDCDFFVFSGHKVYGPTGTGVLYAKQEHLINFQPYQTGGNQIKSVSINSTEFADAPNKFEPGTPNISGFLGLSKALDYISGIGFEAIEAHEKVLTESVLQRLLVIPGISVIGNQQHRSGIISICIDNIHPTDMGMLLGQAGICIRTGFHCNEPLMNFLKINGTIRLSFALYNNLNDIDIFFEKLASAGRILKVKVS